jgi:hypothetical protein
MVRLITGEQECNNQSLTQTTGRGQDKRPQVAARSVDCFCLYFSTIQQCAAYSRKVCHTIKSLQKFCFLHIAESGDG